MRLLLVEDDTQLAALIEQGLREQGYAVDVAHDGQQGLDLAELEPYDVVILDVMLPRLDGLEVCRRLRGQGPRAGGGREGRAVPILVLTARDSVGDRVLGLDSGADDYLVKPFSFIELLARIRALLRRPPVGSGAPILNAGDLTLNPANREVTRGGCPVDLTNKEYQLLEYLVRNPGRILTRSDIASHVWNYDFTATSNVVDVYIRSLRRKLDDDREPRLIRTVRGAGYQLC